MPTEGISMGRHDSFVMASSSGAKLYTGISEVSTYSSGANMAYHGGGEFSVDSYGCSANGSINTSSDRRKKHDISYDISDFETLYSKLRPAKFIYNGGQKSSWSIGFIAQDIVKSLPVARSGFSLVSKNASGYYGIAYTEIAVLNVYMIHKLQKQVAELKRQVDELRGGVANE